MALTDLQAYLHGEVGAVDECADGDRFMLQHLCASSLPSQPATNSEYFAVLASYGPRQVCQYQFKTNDIVWICKQCQKDETCVLCNECYQQSAHPGHDVYFYHSAAGGCCDCGDADAWCPDGFCTRHGKRADDPVKYIPVPMQLQSKEIFTAITNGFEDFCQTFCQTEPAVVDEEVYSLYLYLDDLHSAPELVGLIMSSPIQNLLGGLAEERSEALLIKKGYLKLKSGQPHTALTTVHQLLRTQRCIVRLLTINEERAHAALLQAFTWMRSVCLCCDGLCSLACQVLDSDRLKRLMYQDMFLDKELGGAFHNLLLSLMSAQHFKMTAAVAYAMSFRKICGDFGRGYGVSGATVFNLSVQFLNREHFVNEICYHHSFLDNAVAALYEMVHVYTPSENGFAKLQSVTRRRYSPIIADLKIIFTIPEVSRLFLTTCLSTWLKILEELQQIHQQKRAFEAHVLYEDRHWMHAFNLTLGVGSMYEYLSNWLVDASSPTALHKVAHSMTIAHSVEVSLVDVRRLLTAIVQQCFHWQQSRDNNYAHTASTILDEASNFESLDLLQVQQQHIILRYFSLSFVRTDLKSFHYPLHRFLAYCVLEATKHPHLSSTLYNIGLLLAEDTKHTLSMLFTILQPVLFSCEIRQGKWKRNGQCVYDQLLNYAEPPYSRVFRDLDLVLIQTALIVLPASVFLIYFFNESCIIKSLLQDALEFVGTSVSVEPDFTAGVVADCLHLIINVVTELPTAADSNTSQRAAAHIKREWIHRLASEQCTYSQLQECLTVCSDFPKLPSHFLDQLLLEIAVKNQTSTLSAPTYSLKKELWAAYDPCFPHLNDSAHQSAMDKKPKTIADQPIVQPALTAHECYADVRSKILFDQIMLQAVRNLLHSAAWKRLHHEEYDRQQLLDVAFDCNDNVLCKVIHILTLAVHEARAMASGDQAVLSSFYEAITYERVVPLEGPNGPIFRLDPSTFRTLHRLKAWCEEASDVDNAHYIGWILTELTDLSSECRDMVADLQPKKAADTTQAVPMDFEQLKKLNRDRAMLSMQAAASQFLASLEDISDSDEEATDVEAAGDAVEMEVDVKAPATDTTTDGKGADADQEEELLCIICQTELEVDGEEEDDGSFIGCLALVQCTSVGRCRRQQDLFVLENVPKVDNHHVHRGAWNSSNHRIGLCGHMMHSTCFDAYRGSQHATSVGQSMMILDTSQGYVTCPLCKKLCNTLVPIQATRSSQKEHKQESSVQWMDDVSAMLAAGFQNNMQNPLQFVTLQTKDQINEHALQSLLPAAMPQDNAPRKAVESLLCMVAYTLCMDLAEHIAPGYHLQPVQQLMAGLCTAASPPGYGKYSPGFDDLKEIYCVVEAIGQVCRAESQAEHFIQQLLIGISPPSNLIRNQEPETDLWLHGQWPPLLQLPLFDVAVLAVALSSFDSVIGIEAADGSALPTPKGLAHVSTLINSLPWLCAVKLAQLCVETEPVQGSSIEHSAWPALTPLVDALQSARLLTIFTDVAWRSVLFDWVTFLRALIHLHTRMPAGAVRSRYVDMLAQPHSALLLMPLSLESISDELVRAHMEVLDLQFLLSPQADMVNLFSRWRADREGYQATALRFGSNGFDHRNCGRYSPYPCREQLQLVSLPDDYAKLHAKVLAMCSYELPAVCLMCGAIINAGGHGQCHMHALSCGEGVGAFFLVQECNVVLNFGPRSAYFPSIYLDVYGEIHRTFRGKPLQLDAARLEALRSLWAGFAIASEVVIKRSSANRVIINGYY